MTRQTFEQQLTQLEQLGSNLARYWTVPVSVVLELGSYALVRRGDGLSFIVETKDLEHPKRVNKFIYGWKIQQNWGYGHGWEDVTFEETWKEAREQLKCYRENQPECPVRAVRGREPNPDYPRQKN